MFVVTQINTKQRLYILLIILLKGEIISNLRVVLLKFSYLLKLIIF